jgi:hypothetical protein
MKESNKIIATYPLSEIQKGILFETLKNDYQVPAYIVQNIFTFYIEINLSLLLKAFSVVIERHEIQKNDDLQNKSF